MNRARLQVAVSLSSLLALSVGASAGCGSKCGSACPAIEVTVLATPGENLDWTVTVDGGLGTSWTGPACPPFTPSCRGDEVHACQRFDILPAAEGTCDLTITFKDRPSFVVHGEFGPPATTGCCKGFPVKGPSLVVVPPLGSPPQDAGMEAPPAGGDDATAADGESDGSDASSALD